jgi:hypothetical protein
MKRNRIVTVNNGYHLIGEGVIKEGSLYYDEVMRNSNEGYINICLPKEQYGVFFPQAGIGCYSIIASTNLSSVPTLSAMISEYYRKTPTSKFYIRWRYYPGTNKRLVEVFDGPEYTTNEYEDGRATFLGLWENYDLYYSEEANRFYARYGNHPTELGFFVPTREEKWPGKIEHSAALNNAIGYARELKLYPEDEWAIKFVKP